jgi:hypothetical protein
MGRSYVGSCPKQTFGIPACRRSEGLPHVALHRSLRRGEGIKTRQYNFVMLGFLGLGLTSPEDGASSSLPKVKSQMGSCSFPMAQLA